MVVYENKHWTEVVDGHQYNISPAIGYINASRFLVGPCRNCNQKLVVHLTAIFFILPIIADIPATLHINITVTSRLDEAV